ncbi:TPA: hypothetical protein N0F65_012475 [Lagenidium giganteum]|nr:TPA: hypothetical protein N0F65_012467 [Lagenidium giganteum]DAZ92859.1 TPA: hypothetical protein N0F65_012475 [Lagenidium giganteum]
MALGVAHALEYLHNRPTPIIHRDVKAKNVLLTEQLQTKLIDFGISRDRTQETMTAGVGTPYWSAPEVLEGNRYTEKSDIYSFGVLLSEIDSAATPYKDVRSPETGEPLRVWQIVSMIVGGSLRPTFSDACPQRIARVAKACLDGDPNVRPSANEVIEMLLGRAVSDQNW